MRRARRSAATAWAALAGASCASGSPATAPPTPLPPPLATPPWPSYLPLDWNGAQLSASDEMRNQEAIIQELMKAFYLPEDLVGGWADFEARLRLVARAAPAFPALAFGAANGFYHFLFFRREDEGTPAPPGELSTYLALEDMGTAAMLFDQSLRFANCFDASLDLQQYLFGMCQVKFAMLMLILLELGAAAAARRDLRVSADAFRRASAQFDAMMKVPYHALVGDIGWRTPSDIALNDELYPRTFGATWPRSSVPLATFLEENVDAFRADLASILSQDGLFEHLRQLDRNAEGLAVWPPDARGHVELLNTREEAPFRAGCEVAGSSCALLGSRHELLGCPRAAAFFARLRPGAWLKPHLGNSRRMAVHLGLVIPEGSIELNVGPARKLHWEEGKAIVWDDTHVHDARHHGAHGTRYILQVFFCHPCEQQDYYANLSEPAARALASAEACEHASPVRAEVSAALRAEMDEGERRARAAPKMQMPFGGPVGV